MSENIARVPSQDPTAISPLKVCEVVLCCIMKFSYRSPSEIIRFDLLGHKT